MASTVWRGYISFGLISIPVRLYRAARPERISLRRLYREPAPVLSPEEVREEPVVPASTGNALRLSKNAQAASVTSASTERGSSAAAPAPQTPPVLTPVKQVSVRPSGDLLPRENIVKGYEYERNRFVALEPEELKSAAPQTSASMEISEFVHLAEVDPVYLETSYYVIPEEAGEKAYALLYRSMQMSGLVAVAQFAMHGREHAVVLRPGRHGMLAHTMYFASEVRAEEEFHADVGELSKNELELAQTLIRSLAATFQPEKYRDTYRERIQALIDKKVSGQPIPTAPLTSPKAAVIDIADALRQSLANLKKPPASAAPSATKAQSRPKRQARES